MSDLSAQNIVLPLYHLPPIAYFRIIAAAQTVQIEAQEHFVKGSFRSRWQIAAANKVQLLSIPLCKGKNKQQPFTSVEIAYNDPWQREHWRAIESAYRSSPFWEHYETAFRELYMKRYNTLWERNLHLLEWLMQQLRCPQKWVFTTTYEPIHTDAMDYRASFPTGTEEPRYPQPFEAVHGFRGGLSAVDFLFCVGGRSFKS